MKIVFLRGVSEIQWQCLIYQQNNVNPFDIFCSKKANLVEREYSFVEAPRKFIIRKLSLYVFSKILFI